jgi:hypothetical protein
MRFDLAAAYAMGVGLPLLETLRRRSDFSNLHSYIDDYIIGALLLYAARAVSTGKKSGPVLLTIAWAILSAGLYSSFFWQIASSDTHDVGGLPNMTVVVIKGALYAISLTALVLSARSAISRTAV